MELEILNYILDNFTILDGDGSRLRFYSDLDKTEFIEQIIEEIKNKKI